MGVRKGRQKRVLVRRREYGHRLKTLGDKQPSAKNRGVRVLWLIRLHWAMLVLYRYWASRVSSFSLLSLSLCLSVSLSPSLPPFALQKCFGNRDNGAVNGHKVGRKSFASPPSQHPIRKIVRVRMPTLVFFPLAGYSPPPLPHSQHRPRVVPLRVFLFSPYQIK